MVVVLLNSSKQNNCCIGTGATADKQNLPRNCKCSKWTCHVLQGDHTSRFWVRCPIFLTKITWDSKQSRCFPTMVFYLEVSWKSCLTPIISRPFHKWYLGDSHVWFSYGMQILQEYERFDVCTIGEKHKNAEKRMCSYWNFKNWVKLRGLQSASELYRPSDRRLLAKLVPTFADRGCRVVRATDSPGR
jgi:hypothetical protein